MSSTDHDEPRSSEGLFRTIYNEQLDRLVYNARFILNLAVPFAVPGSASPELIRKMLAAVAAYQNGYSSVDYVLKRYGHHWDVDSYLRDEQQLLVDGILGVIRTEVDAVIKSWTAVQNKPGQVGRVAAAGALLRLRTSFQSAALMVRAGHVYEVYAIGRMILEQSAWAYHVRDLPDEAVLKASPPKAITALKRWIPETGRFYSFLSDHTHIPFHVSRQFVRPAEDDFDIILRSHGDALAAAWQILRLADIYCLVSENVYRDCLPAFRHVEPTKGQVQPRRDRPLVGVIQDYREKVLRRSGRPDAESSESHAT